MALFGYARLEARQAELRQVLKPMTMEQINEAISTQKDVEHLRNMGTNFGKIIVETGDLNRRAVDDLLKGIEKGFYSLGIVAAGNLILIGMGIRAYRRAAESRLRSPS